MLGLIMPGTDSERRKQIRRELRDAERQAAERDLPASKEDLLALFEWVHDKLLEGSDQTLKYTIDQLAGGCDHTLKHTLEFAARHNLKIDGLVQWFNKYGGYCDCEVVINVEDECPAFRA
jgi:Protein of unknown function (DUF2695)